MGGLQPLNRWNASNARSTTFFPIHGSDSTGAAAAAIPTQAIATASNLMSSCSHANVYRAPRAAPSDAERVGASSAAECQAHRAQRCEAPQKLPAQRSDAIVRIVRTAVERGAKGSKAARETPCVFASVLHAASDFLNAEPWKLSNPHEKRYSITQKKHPPAKRASAATAAPYPPRSATRAGGPGPTARASATASSTARLWTQKRAAASGPCPHRRSRPSD